MTEVEKEESQKTVVAFVTGLLIGGLLVWVFSSSPEKNTQVTIEEKTPVEEVDVKKDEISDSTTDTTTDTKEVVGSALDDSVVTGTGALTVADQKAGKMVTLSKTEFPSKKGWVVVRDFMDGTPGNVIGAARYASDEGLVPTTVELVRETVSGSSYHVSFYSDKGNAGFSSAEDTPINGASATFKAN